MRIGTEVSVDASHAPALDEMEASYPAHDSMRNGATNFYAALDLAPGQVIAGMTPALSPTSSASSWTCRLVSDHLGVHVALDDSSFQR